MTSRSTPSEELDDRIDDLSWQFEADWKRYKAARNNPKRSIPKLEVYLNDTSLLPFGIESRAAAFEILLPTELHHRKSIGEFFEFEEYSNRFAEFRGLLDQFRKEFPVDQFIGNYRVIRKLRSGGIGEVFVVEHRQQSRGQLALKRLLEQHAERHHFERFGREIEAHESFIHDNIVRFVDSGFELDGRPYLVTELIDGIDVQELADRGGRWEVADACEIVRQAAIGIEHAHEKNTIHRDLKPGNLMVTTDGVVKVLDFGMAKWIVPQLRHSSFTTTEHQVGTPEFMAPEQAVSGGPIDERADQYGLVATLYFLLSGQQPVINKLTSPCIALLNDFRPEIDKRLVAAVARALEEEPGNRFESIADFRKAIDAFVVGSDLKALIARHRTGKCFDTLPEGTLKAFTPGDFREPKRSRRTVKLGIWKYPLIFVLALVCAIGLRTFFNQPDASGTLVINCPADDVELRIIGQGNFDRKQHLQKRSDNQIVLPEGDYHVTIPGDATNELELADSTFRVIRGKTTHASIRHLVREPISSPPSKKSLQLAPPTPVIETVVAFDPTPKSYETPNRVPAPTQTIDLPWSLVSTVPIAQIGAVSWSPDGRSIAFGTEQGELRLCHGEVLNDLIVLRGHQGPIRAISWRPDGERFVTGSYDGSVCVWSRTGLRISTIDYGPQVADVAWNPMKPEFAAIDTKGKLTVWNEETGNVLFSLKADRAYGSCVRWDDQGETLITCGGERVVRYWLREKMQRALPESSVGTSEIAINPKGMILVCGGKLPSLGVMSGQAVFPTWETLSIPGLVNGNLTWDSTGEWFACPLQVAAGVFVGRVEQDDDRRFVLKTSITIPDPRVRRVAWHPNKRWLLGSGEILRAWSIDNDGQFKEEASLVPVLPTELRFVRWQPGGTQMAVGGANFLQLLRPHPDSVIPLIGHSGIVHDASWSPDGTWLASGCSDKTLRYWTAEGKPGPVHSDHQAEVREVAWSHNGDWLASAENNRQIRLTHPTRGLGPTLENKSTVNSLAWSHDDALLAAGMSGLAGIQLWSRDTNFRTFAVAAGLRDHVNTVSFSRKFDKMAGGAAYGSAAIFDLKNLSNRVLLLGSNRTAPFHLGSMGQMRWNPDGHILATAGGDGLVGLWNFDGKFIGSMRVNSPVAELRWAPNGRWLACGDSGGVVHVWDFIGRQGIRVGGNVGSITSLDWRSDSNLLAFVTTGGMIRQIDMTKGRLVTTRLVLDANHYLTFDTDGRSIEGPSDKLAERFRFGISNSKGEQQFFTPSDYWVIVSQTSHR